MRVFRCGVLACLALLGSARRYSKGKDAVLLSNVQALTLYADKPTSHHRVAAIPQLTCVGGDAKGLYNVDVMRCKNSGSNYNAEDIQWTCQASLPPEFKLGGTEVICEGFDSPDDPYILKGSCGVEYRLLLTDTGEVRYGRRSSYGSFFGTERSRSGLSRITSAIWSLLFWAIFIAVACTILYRVFWAAGNHPRRHGTHRQRGGGGGGGYDDDDDAPPPYSPRAAPSNRKANYASSRAHTATSSRSSNSESWRPGFWTGAMTGAAAGYYMGNRNGSSSRQQERMRQGTFGDTRTGWFGGTGNNPPSSSPWGSSGPSSWTPSGPSSSRHESTGFGGTRRR